MPVLQAITNKWIQSQTNSVSDTANNAIRQLQGALTDFHDCRGARKCLETSLEMSVDRLARAKSPSDADADGMSTDDRDTIIKYLTHLGSLEDGKYTRVPTDEGLERAALDPHIVRLHAQQKALLGLTGRCICQWCTDATGA
jgi:hypothetical protein